MISPYIDAVARTLAGALDRLAAFAMPLAVLLGLAILAGAVALVLQRENPWLERIEWRRFLRGALGYTGVALLVLVTYALLRTTRPLAQQDVAWRESVEATATPAPDAPPVYQYGPSVAALVERTYTRTLTLPPYLLQRVGSEGIGVLAPYLSDPSAENVLRLVDTFRRSGEDVVFTRQVTRLDEEPIPLIRSLVRARFRRLAGRAYDSELEGRYTFGNDGKEASTLRFLFPLPQAGTVRDIQVRVGDQAVTDPNDYGAFEWTGEVKPGESREAVVRYSVLGARSWHYDMGSRRRRVQEFRLDVEPGGPIGFLRGSIQPAGRSGDAHRWELSNVVTAQQVAFTFPPDIAGREAYLQALSALPASLLLFLVGAAALLAASGQRPGPAQCAGALLLFALGLGAAPILASYVGSVAGILLAPFAGAWLAAGVLGRRSLLAAVPAALVPAAFLSPSHTGLLLLLLAAATGALIFRYRGWRRDHGTTDYGTTGPRPAPGGDTADEGDRHG